MPTVWRVVKRRHAVRGFDGEGARLFGGRWNPPGARAVYFAESRALALLEVLVHLGEAGALAGYVAQSADVRAELAERLEESSLPARWWHSPAPPELQRIGAEWLTSRRSAWLSVPSAIVPAERVWILNPDHPAGAKLVAANAEAFRVDSRLAR